MTAEEFFDSKVSCRHINIPGAEDHVLNHLVFWDEGELVHFGRMRFYGPNIPALKLTKENFRLFLSFHLSLRELIKTATVVSSDGSRPKLIDMPDYEKLLDEYTLPVPKYE